MTEGTVTRTSARSAEYDDGEFYYRLELDVLPDRVYIECVNPNEGRTLVRMPLENFEEMLALFGYHKIEEEEK